LVLATHLSTRPRDWFLLGLVLALLAPGVASASAALAWRIERIDGADWHALGLALGLSSPQADRFDLRLRLDRLQLPGEHGVIEDLSLSCALARDAATGWRCDAGRLTAGSGRAGAQDATWQGSFTEPADWRLAVSGLRLAGGAVVIEARQQGAMQKASLVVSNLRLARLPRELPELRLPRDWTLSGALDGALHVDHDSTGVLGARADVALNAVDLSSPDGRYAAEGLGLGAVLDLRRRADAWTFALTADTRAGAAYGDPVYLDAARYPLRLSVDGDWRPQARQLVLDAWQLALAPVVVLSGTGRLVGPDWAARDLTLVARSDRADLLYDTLLQPFLYGTPVEDLDVRGSLGLVLHRDGEGFEQAGLNFSGFAFDDRRERFALAETDGSLAWHREAEVPVSRLAVSGARLYRVPLGAFDVAVHFAGERVSLLSPIVVPVLEGRVALEAFELQGALLDGARPRWRASAAISDVSLDALTRTLALPPFSGVLQGSLADLRYRDGVLDSGGALTLAAFGGEVAVRDLRIAEPLGALPRLTATARLRDLDLERLTGTFAFGRITGRVDGDVRALELVDWNPVRMDLHLYTTPGDDSRHRISQRAVENLTELGSGVPAGLSATFLQLFEDFGYDRIDVKLAMNGDVAEIGGLARDEGGYYLVEGSGLPRIDVIGRNRRVAWRDLLERLRQIQVEGARIE
jgi:hypothetical protein